MTNKQVVCTVMVCWQRVIYIQGRMEQDGPGFYHAKQDTKQFKNYQLFISEIFYLISPSHTWPWLYETTEIEPRNGGEEDNSGLCT